jgi:hypothetical protein
VTAFEQRHGEIVAAAAQRMRRRERSNFVRRYRANSLECRHPRLFEHVIRKLVGEHEPFADLRPVVRRRVRDLVEPVGNPARVGDGAIAGQRPRRGGPDEDGSGRQIARWVLPTSRGVNGKLHPHLVRDGVLVFDLRFGQRGLLHHRPHDRLGAAVERPVGGELHQFARDLRLGRMRHGGIGVLPVALDAEAAELVALHIDPMLGKGAALAAKGDHRRAVGQIRLGFALGAVFLLDLPLDGKAVAVPAGHVVCVVAEHLLRTHHHVLEDLVERGADVDVAVGIGRPVMEDEPGPALGGLAQPVIEVEPRPPRQELGLLLRQPGAHGEIGLRQEQGFAVVAGFLGHRGSSGSA